MWSAQHFSSFVVSCILFVTTFFIFRSLLVLFAYTLCSLTAIRFWKKEYVPYENSFKVWIFWEGHKIWKNLPLKIRLYWDRVKFSVEDFFKFCGLLKISELYCSVLISYVMYPKNTTLSLFGFLTPIFSYGLIVGFCKSSSQIEYIYFSCILGPKSDIFIVNFAFSTWDPFAVKALLLGKL